MTTHQSTPHRAQSQDSPAPDETGMVTSEYAVGTVGACGIGGLLYVLLPWLEDFVSAIIERGLGDPIFWRVL